MLSQSSGVPLGLASPKGQPFPKVRPKRPIACNYCRTKKVRCNGEGEGPCTNCSDRGLPCTSTTPRRWRTRERSITNDDVAERLERVEALLKQQVPTHMVAYPNKAQGQFHLPPPSPVCQRGEASSLFPNSEQRFEGSPSEPKDEKAQNQTRASFARAQTPNTADSMIFTDPGSLAAPRNPAPEETTSSTFAWNSGYAQSTSFDCDDPASLAESSPEEIRERSSISSSEISNWEYHGPRSFLSICSKPGIQWVSSKIGSSSFGGSAGTFTTYITKRLKIQTRLSKTRKEEPDKETAWKYTRAYFEKSLESSLGIIHRPWFEAQLQSRFRNSDDDEDPAWYALRNIVYAIGCRIELSRSGSFSEANQASWAWFENALSVQTEILYFRTSILGVQAMTLMAYFTQNIGCPCLEYALCGAAVRLAVAKGLHRQAVTSWNLSEQENSLRSCLFWATYCLEKQIVSQSGRHSLIDDDDVSCQVPTSTPPGSTMNVEYFNILIRLARISSSASKRLSTVRAFQQGAESMVRSIAELDEQLNKLKSSVDPLISFDTPLNPARLPYGMTLQQTMYLRIAFFSLSLDIHTALTYPWSRSLLGLTPHLALRQQAKESSYLVAETCRQAILATEHIHFDASTPVPLSFFGPMYALINLFIYILQNPDSPGIQSDLALMEVGVGFFAKVRFATESEVSISFAREMAALAQQATETRRGLHLSGSSVGYDQYFFPHTQQTSDVEGSQAQEADHAVPSDQTLDDMTSFFDVEMENWSTFLPVDFDDTLINFSK